MASVVIRCTKVVRRNMFKETQNGDGRDQNVVDILMPALKDRVQGIQACIYGLVRRRSQDSGMLTATRDPSAPLQNTVTRA